MTTQAHTEADLEDAFRDAMANAGCTFDGPLIADGKLHRVDHNGRAKNKKHLWYILHLNEPASGAFGDYLEGVKETWTAKRGQSMTPEERAALKKRIEEDKKNQAAELAKIHAEAADKAAKMMAAAIPAAADHPYLVRKLVKPFNAMKMTKDGKLLIPLKSSDGKLWSVQTIAADGRKRFLVGGKKGGNYWSVGKLTDTIVIAEGYATAATVHMATGFCTVIAFDAGNLAAVAVAIRKKYPDHKIIFAADNDHLTTGNPGVTKATDAARAINATLVVPRFSGELLPDGKAPTDFNDLHALAGLDAVKEAFFPKPKPEPARDMVEARVTGNNVVSLAEARAERTADEQPDTPRPMARMPGDFGPIPLGYDGAGTGGTTYYYMSASSHIVTALTPPQHNEAYFCSLADISYWESEFPAKSGCNWSEARATMIRACTAAGYYKSSRVVGRGLVIDKGRVVLHLGNRLLVDGKAMPTMHIEDSRNIYESGPEIELQRCKPLDPAGGERLIEAVGTLPWRSSDMAPLFAGWLFVAPICGVLPWRTHAWLTGARGSGKTFIVEKAKEILGDLAVQYEGATTEAAIRQQLGRDALPVIFDEAESQNEKARERLQLIVDLARQMSSKKGAKIVKGGASGRATEFHLRSCFIFSSINTGAVQAADQSRIIEFKLEGAPEEETEDQKAEREANFQYVVRKFAELMTPDFGSRLFARALRQVNAIRHNWASFRSAIAAKSGNARMADTISAPLAGWWSLLHDTELTPEEAREILDANGWALSAAERQKTEADHDQAVSHLLDQRIEVNPSRRDNISALIYAASQQAAPHSLESSDLAAQQALAKIGIKVIPGESECPGFGEVYFGSDHDGLNRLYEKTAWAGKRWAGVLKQHPACVYEGKTMRINGAPKKVFMFHISSLVGAD
ncbi:hypothetical protein BA190_09535 [Labrys sp. WJW]|uniref:toprim domain-containing protein n=1 Tax=Labrys sp. WJW TaxID=1737983 RepID=UPI00082A0AB8|nr:toprim domain-containing protein [Labrys sp. WJW]OCC05147.1 hypothetical protein BA190_09535 [Labrys sp. WJW]